MGKMVSIDEALLARASKAAGISEAEAVVREALEVLIERRKARAAVAREAGRRLAAMGGTMPGAWAPNEGDELEN